MKKALMSSIMVAVILLLLPSCKSSQVMVQSSSTLQGEWNIVELNGSSLVPADHQPFPFIGFNIAQKSIYGSAGCNNIMGGYESSKPGKISFGRIGMTMMLCPDMEIETKVTNMLGEVKSYKFISDNQLAFYSKGSKPIAVLEKAERKDAIAKLEGKWILEEIKGENIELDANQPELSFDLNEKRVFGSAGCNRINGKFEVKENVTRSISFPNMAATRMFCDKMELEGKVLEALSSVSSFYVLPSEMYLVFSDAEGNEVLKYKKQKEEEMRVMLHPAN